MSEAKHSNEQKTGDRIRIPQEHQFTVAALMRRDIAARRAVVDAQQFASDCTDRLWSTIEEILEGSLRSDRVQRLEIALDGSVECVDGGPRARPSQPGDGWRSALKRLEVAEQLAQLIQNSNEMSDG